MKARLVCLASVAAMMLSACVERDLYDLEKAHQLQEETYAMTFAKKFGVVPTNHSWDVSTGTSYWRALETRAEGDVTIEMTKSSDFMFVDNDILTYMDTELKESTNNKNKGSKFAMVVPDNDFTLLPICQGNSGSSFDLYIEVDGVTKRVWSKNEGMQMRNQVYKRNDAGQWVLSEKDCGAWRNVTSRTDQHVITMWDAEGNEVTDENLAVKKQITNDGIQSNTYNFNLSEYKGRLMSFYVLITEGNAGYSETGDIQSMLDGYMVSLNGVPYPSNIEPGNEMLIMGCEVANDNNGHKSDWDMNDIVFMIYGNPLTPMVVDVNNDMVERIIEKRYMFEDLGTTDDFDFNDLVIDLRDIATIQVHYKDGKKVSETVMGQKQDATVRHLGGTLPFSFKVGSETIYQGGSPATFGSSPNTYIKLEGTPWEPYNNNVSLVVQQTSSNGEFIEYVVPFPEKGSQAPMAIATDTDVQWMAERVSITPEWFNSIVKR